VRANKNMSECSVEGPEQVQQVPAASIVGAAVTAAVPVNSNAPFSPEMMVNIHGVHVPVEFHAYTPKYKESQRILDETIPQVRPTEAPPQYSTNPADIKNLVSLEDSVKYIEKVGTELKEKGESGERYCLTVDIDGTAIIGDRWPDYCVNQGVLELCKLAVSYGIHVIFITFRPDKPVDRANSERDLAFTGYSGIFQGILYRPSKVRSIQKAQVKTQKRAALIHHLGYSILVNVGNEITDVQGGFAQLHVLV